jgi:hypothetical protein
MFQLETILRCDSGLCFGSITASCCHKCLKILPHDCYIRSEAKIFGNKGTVLWWVITKRH